MRTERTLPSLLRRLRSRLALLHHFVDGERLAKQTAALSGLHRGTTDFRVAHHDDCEALRLARLIVGYQHRVLDRHQRREDLADLFNLDSWVKIAHVDFEHWHFGYSLDLAVKAFRPNRAAAPMSHHTSADAVNTRYPSRMYRARFLRCRLCRTAHS